MQLPELDWNITPRRGGNTYRLNAQRETNGPDARRCEHSTGQSRWLLVTAENRIDRHCRRWLSLHSVKVMVRLRRLLFLDVLLPNLIRHNEAQRFT